jgi:hypothetical protein
VPVPSSSPAALALALLVPLALLTAPLARGSGRPPAAAASASAGAPAGSASGRPAGSASGRPAGSAAPGQRPWSVGVAPDPAPLETRWRWVYEIVYHEGAVFAPTPKLRELSRPAATPRRMGRFAIELFNGPDLVDRVRFELPLLDGDPFTGLDRPRQAAPDFERRVRTRAVVEVPASDRANRAYWVDRATGRRVRLPWPTPPAN